MYRKIVGLARDTFVYGIGSFASTAVSVLLLPVYGRYLTQTEYGAYSILRVVIVVLNIVYEFGIGTSLMRFYFDDQTEEDRRRLFGSAWIFTQAVAITMTIVLILAAGPLSRLLVGADGRAIYVQLIALQALFGIGTVLPTVLFRARRQPGRFIVFSFSNVALMVAATTYFVVWLRMGLVGALGGMLVAAAVFYVISLPFIFANIRLAFWWSRLRELLAFGLPLLPHALSMWVLNFADRLILGKLGSLAQVGVYSFGYNVGMAMSLLVMATQKSWPQFAFSSHASMEESEAKQLFARTARYYWLALCSVALLISVFAPELLALVAKGKYAAAAPIVPIIASAYLFLGLYQVVAVGIGIKKQSKYYFIATGTGALVNLATNLLLIPRYGMFGAAIATVLAYATMCAIIYTISQRLYHIVYEYWRFVLALGLAVAAYATTTLLHGSAGWVVAGKLLVFGTYCGALVLSGVIGRDEIAKAWTLVSGGSAQWMRARSLRKGASGG